MLEIAGGIVIAYCVIAVGVYVWDNYSPKIREFLSP